MGDAVGERQAYFPVRVLYAQEAVDGGVRGAGDGGVLGYELYIHSEGVESQYERTIFTKGTVAYVCVFSYC